MIFFFCKRWAPSGSKHKHVLAESGQSECQVHHPHHQTGLISSTSPFQLKSMHMWFGFILFLFNWPTRLWFSYSASADDKSAPVVILALFDATAQWLCDSAMHRHASQWPWNRRMFRDRLIRQLILSKTCRKSVVPNAFALRVSCSFILQFF